MSQPLGSALHKRYAVRIIPPTFWHEEEDVHLAAAMHSLVLDERSPIALEIVGMASQRCFLLRATTSEALTHALTQLRARYPQADVRPLRADEDPFVMRPGETVSVVELKAGAASYLPLQLWDDRPQGRSDPLLGVLGALDALPKEMRVISQLALVPAPANWSRHDQRKAIEHALEPERQQAQQQLAAQRVQVIGGEGPGFPVILIGGLLLLVLLSYQHIQAWLPLNIRVWGMQIIAWLMAQGHPSTGMMSLPLFMLLGIGCVFFMIIDQWRRRRRGPVYDKDLVGQKTSRMAYRVRLRLYVIGPAHAGISLQQWQRFQHMVSTYQRACVEDWKAVAGERPGKRLYICITLLLQTVFPLLLFGFRCLGQDVTETWRFICVRYSQRKQRASLLSRIIAAYRQYNLASGNYFVPRRVSSRRALLLIQGRRDIWFMHSGWWKNVRLSRHLISVDTLAALWHLPSTEILPDLALIDQKRVRTLPFPFALVQRHQNALQALPVRHLGIAEHAGHQYPVTLPAEALSTHLFIGGKSGEGKSTCLEYLACEAMEQGGLVVIDPHGDLVEHVLTLVPDRRKEDVVLIDLSDEGHAIGFNPLDASQGRQRDKAISDLLKTLAHMWASSWGSRMENAFEYALRTLFEANRFQIEHDHASQQYTLLDVMMLLTDEHFCHSLLDLIDDPFILRWWHLYYDPLNAQMQRERSDPVLSKVAKFESQLARRIVGQAVSTVNFADCIQEEKIVLVKLAKGVIGEDVARLLGATLLGLLQITLEEQGNLVEAQRKHLCILIDEFQVLKGVDWGALAELRKYGAAFYLATQSLEYLADMDASLLHMVLANVKQYIIFHMSARDAQSIHADLGIEPEDIVNLDSYMCYVRLLYENHRQPTFSMTLAPPLCGDEQRAQYIRQESRQRYTVAARTIDLQLREALISSLAARSQRKQQVDQHERTGTIRGQSPSESEAAPLVRQRNGYRGRKSQDRRENTRPQEE